MVELDPFGQDIRAFESVIGRALGSGQTELEAPQEVIDYHNPNGLNGARFFIYKGIKVYPAGEMEAIKKEQSIQLGQRLHGAKEGIVLGRTS